MADRDRGMVEAISWIFSIEFYHKVRLRYVSQFTIANVNLAENKVSKTACK